MLSSQNHIPCSLTFCSFNPYLLFKFFNHSSVCMYVCIYVCMYVRTYVCMYVCMCVCTCARETYHAMYVCAYVEIFEGHIIC